MCATKGVDKFETFTKPKPPTWLGINFEHQITNKCLTATAATTEADSGAAETTFRLFWLEFKSFILPCSWEWKAQNGSL